MHPDSGAPRASRARAPDHARSEVVVHAECYHGSVDEVVAAPDDDGGVAARRGRLGRPWTRSRRPLNRRILTTPFRDMALMSLATSEVEVDRHAAMSSEATGELFD